MDRLPKDLIKIIARMASEQKLRRWIDLSKIHWVCLSGNSNDGAVALLKPNPSKINWGWLSANSGIF